MFRIKICGIKSIEDALAVEREGGDAIGLNFYPKSRRYITVDAAEKIISALSNKVEIVGLFVNSSVKEILEIQNQLKLDWIQLHGDETPGFIHELKTELKTDKVPNLLRAFRSGPNWQEQLHDYIAKCEAIGTVPDAILIDAYHPSEYGGTGELVDWNQLSNWKANLPIDHLVLAGGLVPDNISTAIETVSPTAVDTASGVETSPGVKDHQLLSDFINRARKIFENL